MLMVAREKPGGEIFDGLKGALKRYFYRLYNCTPGPQKICYRPAKIPSKALRNCQNCQFFGATPVSCWWWVWIFAGLTFP